MVNLYGTNPERYAGVTRQMTETVNEFFARYSVPEHSGLNLENQPLATKASPWLEHK
jgi:hypothetical protein